MDISNLKRALFQELGDDVVSDDSALLNSHDGDWSEAPRHAPELLLQPRCPAQVATALAILNRLCQPVVIQGGLTGLAGGATPQQGEVAMSLSRLNRIEAFDALGGTVTVQAGVTLEQVQEHVEGQGWIFPLDLGARGSCQLGGNAATNAGGNRVLRYGTMRERVLGLEVVLPDGTLLPMLGSVRKDTTGIDLKHLFIGAEGTIGVITRLVLALAPKPKATQTALCACSSFEASARLLVLLKRALPGLSAFELMWEGFVAAAVEMLGMPWPFATRSSVYVLIEVHGQDDVTDRTILETSLAEALEADLVDDVIVAQSIADASRLWTYREAVGELLGRLKPFAAFDLGVPLPQMESLVATLRETLGRTYPGMRHLFFGHLGDGNLHVLSGPCASDEQRQRIERTVYEATAKADGRISAEHGIGVLKLDSLSLSRSAPELELMRRIKNVVDPHAILNRGRVLE